MSKIYISIVDNFYIFVLPMFLFLLTLIILVSDILKKISDKT